MGLTIKVNLVQHNRSRNIIDLACDKNPVKKRQLHLREINGGDYKRPIYIGGNHMSLTRKIRGFPYHIILAWQNTGYDGRILRRHALMAVHIFRNIRLERHLVPHCDRIGRRVPLKPHLASQHGGKQVHIRKAGQHIMAACMLHYCRFTFNNHTFCILAGRWPASMRQDHKPEKTISFSHIHWRCKYRQSQEQNVKLACKVLPRPCVYMSVWTNIAKTAERISLFIATFVSCIGTFAG